MKKIIPLILLVILCLALYACGEMKPTNGGNNLNSGMPTGGNGNQHVTPTTAADGYQEGDLKYTRNDDGTWTVTDVIGWVEEIVIPEEYEGAKVTAIGKEAFYNQSNLTSITIPHSVTKIGTWAFADCKQLTSVIIPDGVTSIEERAFSNCKSLTSVIIPDSVTNIENDVFYGCDSLEYNVYDNAKYLGNGRNPYLVLISCTEQNIVTCVIHEDTRIIAGAAFDYCYNLTSITIPDSVTIIGEEAFYDCGSLASVVIGNGLSSIGYRVFYACDDLNNLIIGNGVTVIEEQAFASCDSLTSVIIPDGVSSIGDHAFSNCNRLTSVTIPCSVTSIGEAFSGYNSLSSIHYSGTMEQWHAIKKTSEWYGMTEDYTVYCTDGEIQK